MVRVHSRLPKLVGKKALIGNDRCFFLEEIRQPLASGCGMSCKSRSGRSGVVWAGGCLRGHAPTHVGELPLHLQIVIRDQNGLLRHLGLLLKLEVHFMGCLRKLLAGRLKPHQGHMQCPELMADAARDSVCVPIQQGFAARADVVNAGGAPCAGERRAPLRGLLCCASRPSDSSWRGLPRRRAGVLRPAQPVSRIAIADPGRRLAGRPGWMFSAARWRCAVSARGACIRVGARKYRGHSVLQGQRCAVPQRARRDRAGV